MMSLSFQDIYLLGFASDLGGANTGSAQGPEVMQHSQYLSQLQEKKLHLHWQGILKNPVFTAQPKLAVIAELCQKLAEKVSALVTEKKFFTVIGGDHTSAIGTWSGASHALKNQGTVGLIWIDAHMDSHTPETSLSGNLHGMPLASLLGYGSKSFTSVLDHHPKLKPEQICLIGVRCFEEDEAALLKKLNVRVFFMEEIQQRGLDAVMQEALQIVTQHTVAWGLSIDIDGLDPQDAPGTGVPEPNGISAKELCASLKILSHHPHLIGLEIAEFNPYFDINQKTEKLISNLISSLLLE